MLGAFDEVDLHPDVPAGLRRFRADGVVTVALTNGGLATCEGLLERAGVREDVVHVLSVETVGPWKPHAAAYGHALDVCSLAPEEVLFVAVHPWDLDGAAGAGMRTAYLDRAGTAPTPGTRPRRASPPAGWTTWPSGSWGTERQASGPARRPRPVRVRGWGSEAAAPGSSSPAASRSVSASRSRAAASAEAETALGSRNTCVIEGTRRRISSSARVQTTSTSRP